MKRFFFCLISLISTSAMALPMLTTDTNGQVTGATDISVSSGSFNEIYDVTFMDGSCFDLFTGCDLNSDDLYPINIHLVAANTALLSLLSSFSDSPQLFRGCESAVDCLITGVSNVNDAGPSGGNVGGGTLWVQAGVGNDLIINESSVASRFDDLTLVDNRVYAIWTPSGGTGGGTSNPVSEPPILSLMILSGLIALRRKKPVI